MLQSLDTDGDNKVSWSEFREAFLGPLEDEENEREEVNEYLEDYAAYLKVVFDRVDADGSGSLSYGELVKAERPKYVEAEVRLAFGVLHAQAHTHYDRIKESGVTAEAFILGAHGGHVCFDHVLTFMA